MKISQLNSTITQLYDLPPDPLVSEKDFVTTHAYTIQPKPIEQSHPNVEMVVAEDDPVKPISEMSLIELETAHLESSFFFS